MKVRNIRPACQPFRMAWLSQFPHLETASLIGQGRMEVAGTFYVCFVLMQPEGNYLMAVDAKGVVALVRAVTHKRDYEETELNLLYMRGT